MGLFQVFLVYVFQKLHLLNGYPVKADMPNMATFSTSASLA